MENVVEILLTKVGQQVRYSISIVDLLSPVLFPSMPGAVRYYLAGTPNSPPGCISLVYIADVNCIYKLNVPFIDHEIVI